ncbi:MAG: exodeoxyribonuclease VII small subunit [Bacteroidota bacterium]
MKKEITYKQAYEQLEALVEALESGEISLEQLANKVKEAKDLIAICEKKLRKVEKESNQAMQEE